MTVSRCTPLRLVVDNAGEDRFNPRGVYLVTDMGPQLPARVEDALTGGVCALQFRHKDEDHAAKRATGTILRELCREREIPFIVNDDIALAKELEADGVHLGQDDGTIAAARQALPGKIVGVSTHDLAEAMRAQEEGADYIGFGAMYPTASKEVSYLPGPDRLADVRKKISIPIVAIGGISLRNAGAVVDAGADAVAVISSVLSDPAPGAAAAELGLLFNRRNHLPRGCVMTVAGSDSGGGAGIQADIKTITLLGGYAASAITALTAQNTRGVTAIREVGAPFVEEQMQAVLSDIPVDVLKTGMLLTREIVETVAATVTDFCRKIVVVDPVMVAKGGRRLLELDAVAALQEKLLPVTYLFTPNLPEAELLTERTISTEDDMLRAAEALHAMGPRYVLLKGGHLAECDPVDILYDGREFHRFPAKRIMTRNTHGTGCTYASAIATFLAGGDTVFDAVAKGKAYIDTAIRLAQPLGRGHGPVHHQGAARELEQSPHQ